MKKTTDPDLEFCIIARKNGQSFQYHRGAGQWCFLGQGTIFDDLLAARQLAKKLGNCQVYRRGSIGLRGRNSGKVDKRETVYVVWNHYRITGKLCQDGNVELFRKFRVRLKFLRESQIGNLDLAFRDKAMRPRKISPDAISEQAPYRAELSAALATMPTKAIAANLDFAYNVLAYKSLAGRKYRLDFTDGRNNFSLERNPSVGKYYFLGETYTLEQLDRNFGDMFVCFVVSECLAFDKIK